MKSRWEIPRPPLVLAAALAIASSVAWGCGGGDSSSEQEFRAEANGVCRDAERELDRIQRTMPTTAEQAEKQAEAVAEVAEGALDNLRKIEPPDELRRNYERYLDAREEAIGFIEQSREAAADNNAAGYERGKLLLAEGQPLRRQLALELALRRCSRPSAPGR